MSTPRSQFLALLEGSGVPLLSDGAMGTMLNARGYSMDACFDALNLEAPGEVAAVHRAYIEAGAQIIQTNTFGANRFQLAAYGLAEKTVEINRSGVELARRVVMGSFKNVLVAGDVGPLGMRLAPFGRTRPEQARDAFMEQIGALAEAGADLLVIETFSDLNEIREALAAARQVCDLPVVASLTFTRDDHTLLGDTPEQVALGLQAAGADVIGINCSGGPAQLWRIFGRMRQIVPEERFSVMPNAGWPEQSGGRMMYPAHPDYFGEYAQAFCEAGVRLVGGCCGTGPAHIAAMRAALDASPGGCSAEGLELPLVVESDLQAAAGAGLSRLAQKLADGKFVIAVEMEPPRGLVANKVVAGASLLAEAGADVIDVADTPMARMRMSAWAVCDLIQRQVGVETTLHFPTRGRNLLRVQGDLLAAHALGIHNVFIVLGDPTAIGDYPEALDGYDLVPSGLIRLIKQNFNAGRDQAGGDIGQPTTFFAGCALNLTPHDPGREMRNLRRKLEAGADFILSQPVYEPELAAAFLEQYAAQYGPLDVPILVGALPLFSARHAAFLHNEVPGIRIPEPLQERMRAAGDRAALEGVQITLELIEQMKLWARGVYLMPQFGRYDIAAEVIEGARKLD